MPAFLIMKLILACDINGGIGYENGLPWTRITGDLPRFKLLTMNETVVMGRKTYDSLPYKPLPMRNNVVLSSKTIPEVTTVSNIDELLKIAQDSWYVIGGASVISQLWDNISVVHLTRTKHAYICDTHISLMKLEQDYTQLSSEEHIDHTYEIWRKK